MVTRHPSTQFQGFVQALAPDDDDSPQGAIAVGDVWIDTTAALLKRCSSIGPIVWTSTEGGSSAHDILSSTHGDALASAVSRGSIIIGNATPAWAELAVGTNGQVLQSDGTDIAWGSAGSGDVTGPASSVDNRVPTFSGTGGKTIQDNNGVTLDDSGNMDGVSFLTLLDPTTLTIATGDVTAVQSVHLIAGEGGAADQLDGIAGGSDGRFLLLAPSSDSVDITVVHNQNAAGTNNILLSDGASFLMDTIAMWLLLVYRDDVDTNGAWVEVARSSSAAKTETLTNKTLTTPTISATGYANANHAHAAADSGGQVAHSALSGIGAADHQDEVTLAGTPDYITISGQVITRAQINLTADVTGVLPEANLPNASATAEGVVELATQAEVDAGTDAGRVVTPDTLAGSDLMIKYVQMVVFDFTTNIAVGDGAFYFHIPAGLGGMNLVEVHAEVITAGTTGTTDVQIANVTQAVDMLSTKLTIDSAETGSDTALTAAVIDTLNDDVAENDVLRVDVDAISTTAPKGLIVTLGFQLP